MSLLDDAPRVSSEAEESVASIQKSDWIFRVATFDWCRNCSSISRSGKISPQPLAQLTHAPSVREPSRSEIKRRINSVFPIPRSPVTKTVEPLPAIVFFQRVERASRSLPRPTKLDA